MLRKHIDIHHSENFRLSHPENPQGGYWQLYKWDARQIPTYEDKVRIINELSERNRRQLAIEYHAGRNILITAGKTALLKGLSTTNSAYSTIVYNNWRLGSGTTTPTAASTDVETIISPQQSSRAFTVSGTTATWELFLTGSDNIGTLGNAVICSGSPGTLLTHFLINPATAHTADDTITLTYALGVT